MVTCFCIGELIPQSVFFFFFFVYSLRLPPLTSFLCSLFSPPHYCHSGFFFLSLFLPSGLCVFYMFVYLHDGLPRKALVVSCVCVHQCHSVLDVCKSVPIYVVLADNDLFFG